MSTEREFESDEWHTPISSFGTRGKAWLGALGVVILVGFVAWLYQIQAGLTVTGMNNVFSWGLYIMMFVLFIGLSAGGLIISSTPKFFHSKKFVEVSRIGVLLSLATITVAGLLIIPDIGRPLRLYQFFTTPDFRSPMVWDFLIVLLYGVLTLWYLWLLTRRDLAARGSRLAFGVDDTDDGREHDRKLAFWTSVVAIPAAVLLHSITGWIFATQIGRGDWFSPLVAPVFIAKALVSGLGLLLVSAILVERFTDFELPDDSMARLGKVLGVFTAIHVIYLLGAERLPHAWAQNFGFWDITTGFLVGDTLYFWMWTIVGGAIPIVILAIPSLRTRTWAVFTASVLAVFGIMFEGIRLVFIGYDEVNIDAAPGITTGDTSDVLGTDIWATSGTYTPTVIEFLVTIGIIAIGVLIFTIGLRYLPVARDTVAVTDGGEETG
jgi:molybdopterin-containing oxidoreductase family membrane subunit